MKNSEFPLLLIIPLTTILLVSSCKKIDAEKSLVKDVGGDAYKTVQIGTQLWLAENLRVTKTPDGVLVANYFPNDDSSNVNSYGRLYDWTTACKVCPQSWHLPTDEEWKTLENYLGTNAGGKLKDTLFWNVPNAGATNEQAFSARASGYWNGGQFDNQFGVRSVFWSSTRADTHFVWCRSLSFDNALLRRANQHPQYGFSVRCVKDK